MIEAWKYSASSANNFCRQVLLAVVVYQPEIFKIANIDPKSECLDFTEGFPFDFPYVLISL